jgi:plasmid stabilization system protein ParE
MLPIDLLPEARRDFDDSFDWYAERSVEAAVRFADAVDATYRRVAAGPEQFAAVDKTHRECRVMRFPFRIIYRIEPSRVLVVAVAHAKRRPGFWKRRG